jgi:hypothetical protein
MITDLTSVIALLALGTPLLILIMFLPAFLELKRPKDGGPRIIMDGIPEARMGFLGFIQFVDIEEEQKFDNSLIRTLAKINDFLPSLEV